MADSPVHRWTCVEAGCDDAAYAADQDALVAAVMQHIRRDHDSFELEEMILAAIEPVAAADVPAGLVTVGTVSAPPAWATASASRDGAKRSMEWSPERGLDDV